MCRLTARPSSPRAKQIADLVEIVIGSRGFAQVFGASMELVEEGFRAHGIKYTRTEDTVYVALAGSAVQPDVTVSVGLCGAAEDLFAITAATPDVSFARESEHRLVTFASEWNPTCGFAS